MSNAMAVVKKFCIVFNMLLCGCFGDLTDFCMFLGGLGDCFVWTGNVFKYNQECNLRIIYNCICKFIVIWL